MSNLQWIIPLLVIVGVLLYIRLHEDKKELPHEHDWEKWSQPWRDGIYEVQTRHCTSCNYCDKRYV